MTDVLWLLEDLEFIFRFGIGLTRSDEHSSETNCTEKLLEY
jgi:hypothetical protein